jgi:TatD DNase family protein
MILVDSHAHLDGEEFEADMDEVVARARAVGVRAILTVGTGDPASGAFERAFKLASKYDFVYAAAGVHPHDAAAYDGDAERRLKHVLKTGPKALAWGEMGLDYHYDHSPREVQREAFARQLRAAAGEGWPVIIHSREADEDTLEILRNIYGRNPQAGVMHCFGGGRKLLEGALELGFMISFAGNVTFKNADHLRMMARLVPVERLLIETDCPFLSPVPYRGRRNEPARVYEVAVCLADLLGLTKDELGRIVAANFFRFFKLAGLSEGVLSNE